MENPHPAISVFNFHYATPPDAVALNYSLNRPLGDNETGFRGTNNLPYRTEAWAFILAGGALYNNLDYSFVAGHENGDFIYPASQPGGGNSVLRSQLRTLRDFIYSFDFISMKPDPGLISGGLPESSRVYALSKPGQHAVYFMSATVDEDEKSSKDSEPAKKAGAFTLQFQLPAGNYSFEWLDPISGRQLKKEDLKSAGSIKVITPEFTEDLALAIRKKESGF